ncbi:hypothetical protein M426DRAFT_21823 [Hypoxylon sp. CI-4A]|nr:hypothetical protein M426DRAFT_21823 [Hypoxylon sp. CI-4A]
MEHQFCMPQNQIPIFHMPQHTNGVQYVENLNPNPNSHSYHPYSYPTLTNRHFPIHLPQPPPPQDIPHMFDFHMSPHVLPQRDPMVDSRSESKPRLSKEEVEKLESVFQENPKPSSAVKAQLADSLQLDRPRVNNWFQNRRAKAKQEKKQEEYEATRAAEKANSEPVSPAELSSSAASENGGESIRRRVQPSSARFPGLNSTSHATDLSPDEEKLNDNSDDSDSSSSPITQVSVISPKGVDSDDFFTFQPSDATEFSHTPQQGYSHDSFNSFLPSQQGDDRFNASSQQIDLSNRSTMMDTDFTKSMLTPILQSGQAFETRDFKDPMAAMQDQVANINTPMSEGQSMSPMRQGMNSPADSFRSPPPPANIASRRNIQRPATLQTKSLRSQSYNLGCGPKTALDSAKRMDSSSPVAPIRRIASTTGNFHGRIQKNSAMPRSPRIFSRPEALLHYQNRSPGGFATGSFLGAAPPTPMTPAVGDQSIREPVVSSSNFGRVYTMVVDDCPDHKHDCNLKTPPTTPDVVNPFAPHYQSTATETFSGTAIDYDVDSAMSAPFFQTEFNNFGMSNLSGYSELNDGSHPTTPLYPNMMNLMQEQNTFGHGASGNTQYDWDANEAVNSKSSPNLSRSKQIQFTQNMTPQDYTSHQEK